jgi:glycerophosphoryl diester phosphodiesterase
MDEGEEDAPRRRRVGKKTRIALAAVAGVAVLLSLINASWIAAQPSGRLVVVARHGLVQQVIPRKGCEARRLRFDADNPYIENTLSSIYKAARLGADAVEVDVQASADGQAVVFRDADLGCRTDGTGPLRARTLADLKRLDVGAGYTADDGKTFPFRGHAIGGIPTVEEMLREVPRTDIIFRFVSGDAAEADALVAALRRAGATDMSRFGFEGPGAATARVRQALGNVWTFAPHPPGNCVTDYVRIGWTSIVPASCRGATVALTVGDRWKLWGWPYRFLDRLAGAGANVMMFGEEKDGQFVGLTDVTQYDKVPRGFRGHLFIEDFNTVGAALRR